MRKQYHLWPRGDVFDAWDVSRLIELAADLPVEEYPIARIRELDSIYWFDEVHRPTVRSVVEHARLMQKAELQFPIILGPDGRVVDGMHRIARCLLTGRDTISAVCLPSLPEPDYRGCLPRDLPY